MVARNKAATMAIVEVATIVVIVEVVAYVGRHKGMEVDSSKSNNQFIQGSRQSDRQSW